MFLKFVAKRIILKSTLKILCIRTSRLIWNTWDFLPPLSMFCRNWRTWLVDSFLLPASDGGESLSVSRQLFSPSFYEQWLWIRYIRYIDRQSKNGSPLPVIWRHRAVGFESRPRNAILETLNLYYCCCVQHVTLIVNLRWYSNIFSSNERWCTKALGHSLEFKEDLALSR